MWEGAAFCVEEETETQKGWVVCLRPHSWEVSEPGCQTDGGLCLPISALPHEGGGGPFLPDPTARGLRGHVTLNGHTSPILGLMPVLPS